MKDISKLTDAQLDEVAATEIMGWTWETKVAGAIGPRGFSRWLSDGEETFLCNQGWSNGWRAWSPTSDRNQARIVVEAAGKLLGKGWMKKLDHRMIGPEPDGYEWINATPRQEVEAAVRAARER